jgi:hypothetical protein
MGLIWGVALAGMAAAMLAAPAIGAVHIQANGPQALFHEGDQVTVQVAGAGPAITAELTPYGGAARPVGPVHDGVISLGLLPRGFYSLKVTDAGSADTAGIVVLPRIRQIPDSRLAVDAAHAWLIPEARFNDGAHMLQDAGFTWARERFTWGEVEPTRGAYQWGKYDAIADADHAAGVSVDQIFHSSAAWSRADHATNRFPDDLRDVYNFAREAAVHFKGRVKSWEVWNEADITGFSVDPANEYAAFLKAAYLGFKAGDPNVIVTQVALAEGAGRFEDLLYRNDTLDYFDVFNYHIYANPQEYPGRAAGHFAMLDRYSAPNFPVWVTEAGIRLEAPDKTLSADDARKQADFIPQSYVMSLASGTDRHFFFVFPHYMENGIEFGTMDAAMRPYPGYAALATVVDQLGEAKYLGRVTFAGSPNAQAYLFDNGKSDTLVAWQSAGSSSISLPALPTTEVTATGSVVQPQGPAGGLVKPTVTIGASPVYVQVPHGTLHADGKALARRKHIGTLPMLAGRDLVVRLRFPDSAMDTNSESYRISAGASVPVSVQIYNFSDATRKGTLHLSAPAGWMIQPAVSPVDVTPMGLQEVKVDLLAGQSAIDLRGHVSAELVAPSAGAWGKGLPRSSPAVADVYLDPSSLKAVASVALGLDNPALWQDNISNNGSMTHTHGDDGGVSFDINFARPGDRWAYPTATVDDAKAWPAFDGLQLEFAANVDDSVSRMRVMLVQKNGSAYYTAAGYPLTTQWQKIIIPWDSVTAGSFAPADPGGKLDLSTINLLRFGVNTQRDHIVLRLKNVALVRFRPAK